MWVSDLDEIGDYFVPTQLCYSISASGLFHCAEERHSVCWSSISKQTLPTLYRGGAWFYLHTFCCLAAEGNHLHESRSNTFKHMKYVCLFCMLFAWVYFDSGFVYFITAPTNLCRNPSLYYCVVIFLVYMSREPLMIQCSHLPPSSGTWRELFSTVVRTCRSITPRVTDLYTHINSQSNQSVDEAGAY